MASKNSAIWNFFDQVENEPKFAKCKFCGKKLSLGSENAKNQTTTGLKNGTFGQNILSNGLVSPFFKVTIKCKIQFHL